MIEYKTTDELEAALGEQIRAARLRRNLVQSDLAKLAGVAVNSVRSLERGQGATVATLVRVLKAMGVEDWIASLQPQVTISPLQLHRAKAPRQRAYKHRGGADGEQL